MWASKEQIIEVVGEALKRGGVDVTTYGTLGEITFNTLIDRKEMLQYVTFLSEENRGLRKIMNELLDYLKLEFKEGVRIQKKAK